LGCSAGELCHKVRSQKDKDPVEKLGEEPREEEGKLRELGAHIRKAKPVVIPRVDYGRYSLSTTSSCLFL